MQESGRLNGSTALNDANQNDDEGQEGVRSDYAEQPQNQEDDANRPQDIVPPSRFMSAPAGYS